MTLNGAQTEVLWVVWDFIVNLPPVRLDANERRFLVTFVLNEQEWELLGIPHLAQLPGLKWKLNNLERLASLRPKEFHAQAETLEKFLIAYVVANIHMAKNESEDGADATVSFERFHPIFHSIFTPLRTDGLEAFP